MHCHLQHTNRIILKSSRSEVQGVQQICRLQRRQQAAAERATAACMLQQQACPSTHCRSSGRQTRCRAVAADAAFNSSSIDQQLTISPTAPHTSSAAVGPAWHLHDIVKATTADGSELYLEVIHTPREPTAEQTAPAADQQPQLHHNSLQVVHKGVIYTVQQTQQQLLLQPQGWQLHPDHPLVKALPGWSNILQLQQSKQTLPQQPVQLESASVVTSAGQLKAAVQRNSALWCNGTGPLDPPLTGLQYQTLAAGELECLLNHTRGLVMLQLSVAWAVDAPQPANNPLVLYNLQRALQDGGISIYMSPAQGGLGLTAILCAKAEPWRAWAAHLVSFNAQAALVAGSPYYKLMIGRMLGYKEDNIRFHIQSTDGRQHPTPETIAAVDKDMRKLSKKKPQLPWVADAAASSRAAGKTQRQQQPRSARKKR